MKIFIICPVRIATPEVIERLRYYVLSREHIFDEVYWPYRDTDQGAGSFEVCRQNIEAIRKADRVDVWYDPESEGSKFDLGAAFALNKPIYIINTVKPTECKSFENLLLEWEQK